MERIFNKFRLVFGIRFRTMLQPGARQLLVMSGLALTIVAAAVPAQKIQTPHLNARKIHSTGRIARSDSGSARAAQQPTPDQPPPLSLLTTEQTVPNPPRVSYEGGQLTIVAENSELSDVLSLLKKCTGADIDFPPSAAHERIWAGLGPGPARSVLATLLSGIGLDYAIQASDIDPQGVRSLLLSTRTKPGIEEAPEQENPPSQEPEAASEVAPEDLRSAPAKLQPSTEIAESAANEPATSPEVAPAEVQPSPEAAHDVAAIQFPFNDAIVAGPYENIAEDPRLAVYIGQPVGVGGMVADVMVYESGDVFVIIRIDGEDKLPGMPRAIFVGDPSRLRHHLEFSNWK
jgi:hypothetical protein